MKIIRELTLPQQLSAPAIITIGNYDGIHLGHQQVLNRVIEIAEAHEGIPTVLTFVNHPNEVLKSLKPLNRLCTTLHKVRLLEDFGIELVALLEFNRVIASLSPRDFLEQLMHAIPFSHLILGHDASFGKNREGNQVQVKKIAAEMGFQVEYIAPYALDDVTVSSSRVRENLLQGKLDEVERLFGRRYSIRAEVLKGLGKGKHVGYPTANIDVTGLCLPPLGVYAVDVLLEGQQHHGIANLGIAPTVRHNPQPVLEVHLFQHHQDIYSKEIEVVFKRYLRVEKQFLSVEELRKQIAADIAAVLAQDGDDIVL
jgi:riboflavin kinase/FMN adenylyltransferase